jgi:hypothetical protein
VGGLHGPNPFLEPVKQRQIIGSASKERLTEMYVGLNETRQHCASGGVEGDIGCLIFLADTRNAPIAD